MCEYCEDEQAAVIISLEGGSRTSICRKCVFASLVDSHLKFAVLDYWCCDEDTPKEEMSSNPIKISANLHLIEEKEYYCVHISPAKESIVVYINRDKEGKPIYNEIICCHCKPTNCEHTQLAKETLEKHLAATSTI